jgi:hypothetical protein
MFSVIKRGGNANISEFEMSPYNNCRNTIRDAKHEKTKQPPHP